MIGLNLPVKRHRMAGCIKKQDPSIYLLQQTHLSSKDKHRLKVKRWKMILQANGSQKKAGVAILISDKVDFKPQKITRDKDGQDIMIKGPIHQEDITNINIYAPNIGAPKYIKQLLTDTKREIDSNTKIVGDFNTPLHQQMDQPNRKSTREE